MLFAPDIVGEPNATELLNPVIKTFVVGDISTLLREKVAACPVKFIFASPTSDIEPTDEVMAKELRETFTEAKSPPKELNGLSANAVIPNIIYYFTLIRAKYSQEVKTYCFYIRVQ